MLAGPFCLGAGASEHKEEVHAEDAVPGFGSASPEDDAEGRRG